ncbi:hypothetical protein RSSM_02697 [Rhodopirellula sallentina SM41]|uniref:Uncharacterized protein n=1 Tax=Rhodopirellula sallentina SM41 TaxID=1263870 RepID=M5U339_9BACT|nr:hypothetical protein RSSM_02697 [Rhodopirellula sallentina SM41]
MLRPSGESDLGDNTAAVGQNIIAPNIIAPNVVAPNVVAPNVVAPNVDEAVSRDAEETKTDAINDTDLFVDALREYPIEREFRDDPDAIENRSQSGTVRKTKPWNPADTAPPVLRSPLETAHRLPEVAPGEDHTSPLFRTDGGHPYGFTGRSGIVPTECQSSNHFIPVTDLWRIGQQDSDRYGKGHPMLDDYPGVKGVWWDPYNQNVLKGDYPILGEHTFLKLTGKSFNLFEGRQLPTPTTPFEATRNPGAAAFFGDPDSFLMQSYNSVAIDLFHGNAAFKPNDWRIRLNTIYNMNNLTADELGVVNPDVRAGTSRFRDDFALEEWFFEAKLADLSPYYDFVSTRVGSQPFVSDFRGFLFADINRGVRLFGTRKSNRDQFNVIWFDQTEKDSNSLLNRFSKDRHQNTLIANYYRQDFLYPGLNANVSFHANHDGPSFEINQNDFLVRPDPAGIAQPHEVRAYYFGAATNGHIERFNYSTAFYYAFGRDDLNPIAGRGVDISASMAAIELSYDRDWVRFRTSYLYSSGDKDPNDQKATGFDAILPNPNFAGTEFSYWGRQDIRLFGVELTNRLSLTPSMKSNKFQGQSNFVNPGLHLVNFGLDADLTPKMKTINNVNLLWFDDTSSLETYLFTGEVRDFIGTDISSGLEYRPLLNNNIVCLGGLAALFGGDGFADLFQRVDGTLDTHVAGFLEVVLEF